MRILAIETSCDETAAAVIQDRHRILANTVASQMALHARFGGIYPEVASRQHVLAIDGVIERALQEAGVTAVSALHAIAVTCGPGLAGSLMVGVNAAKGLSLASGVPLIGVNHLAGHIHSLWLDAEGALGCHWRDLHFPLVILIVSGGHTELVLMEDAGCFRSLGSTLDDAAGEAFDKVARILGLGFPGGPAIQAAAAEGQASHHRLPYPLRHDASHRFDFSFSGLKTAMLHRARQAGIGEETVTESSAEQAVHDLAAAFQSRVTGILLDRTEDAVRLYNARAVGLCGGVSANQQLRTEAMARFGAMGIPLRIPPLALCTDNAAMIGAAACYQMQQGVHTGDGLDLDVAARLPLAPPRA